MLPASGRTKDPPLPLRGRPHRRAHADHTPGTLRLGETGERLRAEILDLEQLADLSPGTVGYDQCARPGQRLQTGGEVWRLADHAALLRSTRAGHLITRPDRSTRTGTAPTMTMCHGAQLDRGHSKINRAARMNRGCDTYRMERACAMQLTFQQSGAAFHPITDEVVSAACNRPTGGRNEPAKFEWPALLRKLDRIHPSYKQ
jgi:hypothetical protein